MTQGDYIIWIYVFTYIIYLIECYITDWKNNIFEVINKDIDNQLTQNIYFSFLLIGICCAMVNWNCPAFSLIFPILLIFITILFNITVSIITKEYTCGLISSILLFLPVTIWLFYTMSKNKMIDYKYFIIPIISVMLLFLFLGLLLSRRNEFVYSTKKRNYMNYYNYHNKVIKKDITVNSS